MSAGVSTARVSERLIEAADPAWQRALEMRFVREATDGTLPDEVLMRYLSIEADFVTVACRALGAAVLRSPDLTAIRGHAATMASFLADQHEYFDRARAAGLVARPGPGATRRARRLGDRVLELCDNGSYATIVCCMYPSELLYQVWCARAAAIDVPRSPMLEEWITSHAATPYTDTVAFLIGQVDGLSLADSDIAAMADVVGEVLDLECEFHDAAYDAT